MQIPVRRFVIKGNFDILIVEEFHFMFLIIIGSIFLSLQTVHATQKTNTNVFKYIFDRSSKPSCVINIQGKLHRNSTMENEYLFQDKRQIEFLHNSRINRLLLTAVLEEETEDNIAYLQKLIEDGHHIDVRDEHNQTPLMLASAYGHIEFVKILLKEGANCALRSDYGNFTSFGLRARDFAQNNGHEEIAKILDQHLRDAHRFSYGPYSYPAP